jgi:hypothetical protein
LTHEIFNGGKAVKGVINRHQLKRGWVTEGITVVNSPQITVQSVNH